MGYQSIYIPGPINQRALESKKYPLPHQNNVVFFRQDIAVRSKSRLLIDIIHTS